MASPSWRVVDPDTCLPYVWVFPPIRWKSSWPRQGHPTDPAVPPLSLLKEVSIAGDRLRTGSAHWPLARQARRCLPVHQVG